MVQGSFDSADFFASEEICGAQDDKEQALGSGLSAFGSRLLGLGKETPGCGLKRNRNGWTVRAGPPLLGTSERQSDAEGRTSRFTTTTIAPDYNETFTAMLTPGCWRL